MRFLFVDRIVELIPGQLIRGMKHITADSPFLTVDESGRPCFMSSLIGETLGQLAAWNVMQFQGFTHRPVAGVVARASMHRPAYVGETLLLESYIDYLDQSVVQYHSEARVGTERVFVVEGALGPLLPMDNFIELDHVKKQFTEINNPGDWLSISTLSVPILHDNSIMNLEGPVFPMTFDRIRESQPGVSLVAEKHITCAAPYFPDHFPKKPVLPMTVLLECKLNLAREFIARADYSINYSVSELRKIKMNEFVQPGDTLECFVHIKKQTQEELILAYRSEVAGKRVCVLEIVLLPRGT